MSAQPEIWRVSTREGVFEANFETLTQWIAEGAVLPTDKVTKGTQSWIEAGRVPRLRPAFSGEPIPVPPPVVESAVESTSQTPPSFEQQEPQPPKVSRLAQTNACHNHPDAAPVYTCRMCNALLCADCPRLVSNTPVCPLCGDLCHKYEQVRSTALRREFQGSGFGFADFQRAFKYPFQHKLALLAGALVYGLLLLSGFRGSLIAWMIMFGCISHVISQVAWGRLHRSFMPDLSSFSMWDDIVLPIFLGIGIMIVSWGPVIALVLALMFGALGTKGVVETAAYGNTPAATANEPSEEDLEVLTDPEADPKKLEEANKKLNQTRPGAQIAQEAERSQDEQNDPAATVKMLLPYLSAGIVFVVLILVGVLWAVFYYPMALTVAGFTQSFLSVINPLVGLDTIRRMGGTYFKAFAMVLFVQFVAVIIGGIVGFITSPFTLPFVGNLPANLLNGMVTFYFNLVIACVLGLALHKCADRLGISVD
jgi:hypothetical protein